MYLAISERWGCGLEEAIRARLTPDLSPAATLQVLIEVTGEHVRAETDACRILMEGWNLERQIPALAERARRGNEWGMAGFWGLAADRIAHGEVRWELGGQDQDPAPPARPHRIVVQPDRGAGGFA